jgi:hypothetical protein
MDAARRPRGRGRLRGRAIALIKANVALMLRAASSYSAARPRASRTGTRVVLAGLPGQCSLQLAVEGYQAFVRSYATHARSTKHIFSVHALHLGESPRGPHARACARTRLCTNSCPPHTHTPARARTHTHRCTRTPTHTRMHARTHTDARIRTDARKHTRTGAPAHTRTDTRRCARRYSHAHRVNRCLVRPPRQIFRASRAAVAHHVQGAEGQARPQAQAQQRRGRRRPGAQPPPNRARAQARTQRARSEPTVFFPFRFRLA